jgi:hypothetical protein
MRLQRDWARSVHWSADAAPKWFAQQQLGGAASLYRAGVVGLNLRGPDIGLLIGDTTRQRSVLGELGFVIAEAPTAPDGTELIAAEDESLTAIVAVVVWSQHALAELHTRSRTIATSGRLVIAQTGAVLRELGVTVTDKAEEVGQKTWEGPLWVVRAHVALAEHLTPDERRALKHRRWDLYLGTATCVFAPLVPGSLLWALTWSGLALKLHAFYEEIARLSHLHGLDELVPPTHRHDG